MKHSQLSTKPAAPQPFDRHQSPGHVINYLARLFAKALYRRIATYGVNPGQFPVLLMLWEREGVTQTELADRLAVEQPTMAGTLKRLERDDLITRVPDANDRRQARVHLTRRGRELQGALTTSARETNAVALQGLTARHTAQLLSLAKRMIANLEQDSPTRL